MILERPLLTGDWWPRLRGRGSCISCSSSISDSSKSCHSNKHAREEVENSDKEVCKSICMSTSHLTSPLGVHRAGWSLTQGCRLGYKQFATHAAVAMCLPPPRTRTQGPTLRHSALAAAVTPPHLARLGCAPSHRWLQGCAGKAPVAEHRSDSQAPGKINAATSLRASMMLRSTILPWLQVPQTCWHEPLFKIDPPAARATLPGIARCMLRSRRSPPAYPGRFCSKPWATALGRPARQLLRLRATRGPCEYFSQRDTAQACEKSYEVTHPCRRQPGREQSRSG